MQTPFQMIAFDYDRTRNLAEAACGRTPREANAVGACCAGGASLRSHESCPCWRASAVMPSYKPFRPVLWEEFTLRAYATNAVVMRQRQALIATSTRFVSATAGALQLRLLLRGVATRPRGAVG